jgi:acyl carrier protein
VTEAQILEGVRQVIRDELRLEVPVAPSSNLVRDLELDSLRQLTLVVELENRFQVRLDVGDEEGLETLADVVRLIHRRLSENGPRD